MFNVLILYFHVLMAIFTLFSHSWDQLSEGLLAPFLQAFLNHPVVFSDLSSAGENDTRLLRDLLQHG